MINFMFRKDHSNCCVDDGFGEVNRGQEAGVAAQVRDEDDLGQGQ